MSGQQVHTMNVSVAKCREAVSDEKRKEAFSFAILIKILFASSQFNYATLERLAKQFGISKTRAKRLRDNALKFGYITIVNTHILALPVKDKKGKHYKWVKDRRMTLDDVIKHIEEIVAEDFIDSVNFLRDTQEKARDGKTVKEVKRARKYLQRVKKPEKDIPNKGISIQSIMQRVNIKRNRAINLMKRLAEKGIITKIVNIVPTKVKPEEFTEFFVENYKKYAERGFPFIPTKGKHRGMVVIRYANNYLYHGQNLFFM